MNNLCVDTPVTAQRDREVKSTEKIAIQDVANFFVSPMRFFVQKGVDLGQVASSSDIKSIVTALKPAMSPDIQKAVGDLLGLASVMGVDLTASNPMIQDIQKALKEGVKGYLSVRAGGQCEL